MGKSCRSFDVFDTLIARRCVGPVELLRKLEARADLSSLAEARLAADQRLGMRGQPYDLLARWREVGQALRLDESTTTRLLALEIQIEHEEIIPIADLPA